MLSVALLIASALLVAITVNVTTLPVALCVIYILSSIVTFSVYAFDKAAARGGRWRTRESTLHILSAMGGWPGALIAQRVLHHKSRKEPFQLVFRITVVANCAVAALLIYTA